MACDVWTNREIATQRENEKFFGLLQDPNLEKEIKEEILKILKGKYQHCT